MNLWILRPTRNTRFPKYDVYCGFVIRAETEQAARDLANTRNGDECHEKRVWLDPKLTSCVPLTNDGPAEIVMEDFRAG